MDSADAPAPKEEGRPSNRHKRLAKLVAIRQQLSRRMWRGAAGTADDGGNGTEGSDSNDGVNCEAGGEETTAATARGDGDGISVSVVNPLALVDAADDSLSTINPIFSGAKPAAIMPVDEDEDGEAKDDDEAEEVKEEKAKSDGKPEGRSLNSRSDTKHSTLPRRVAVAAADTILWLAVTTGLLSAFHFIGVALGRDELVRDSSTTAAAATAVKSGQERYEVVAGDDPWMISRSRLIMYIAVAAAGACLIVVSKQHDRQRAGEKETNKKTNKRGRCRRWGPFSLIVTVAAALAIAIAFAPVVQETIGELGTGEPEPVGRGQCELLPVAFDNNTHASMRRLPEICPAHFGGLFAKGCSANLTSYNATLHLSATAVRQPVFIFRRSGNKSSPDLDLDELFSSATETARDTRYQPDFRQLNNFCIEQVSASEAKDTAASLDEFSQALALGLLQVNFGRAYPVSSDKYRYEFQTLFGGSKECSGPLLEAVCALALPLCSFRGCLPMSRLGCVRAALNVYLDCTATMGLNFSSTETQLLDDLVRFYDNWMKPAWSEDYETPVTYLTGGGYITPAAGCALKYYVAGMIAALHIPENRSDFNCLAVNSEQADDNNDAGVLPAAAAEQEVAAQKPVCDPAVLATPTRRRCWKVLSTVKADLFVVVAALLGIAVSVATFLSSLSRPGLSSPPIAIVVFQQLTSRKASLRRGQGEVLFTTLMIILVSFVGGLRTELLPGGVADRKRRCAESESGDIDDQCTRDHALENDQFGWELPYYVLVVLAVLLAWKAVLPLKKPGRGGAKKKSGKIRRALERKTEALVGRFAMLRQAKEWRAWYGRMFGMNHGEPGKRFLLKTVLSECFEIATQLITLSSSLDAQESTFVVTTFVLIGLGVLIIPVTVLAAARCSGGLRVASDSGRQRIKLIVPLLLTELIFDIAFVFAGVFLKHPTREVLKITSGDWRDRFWYHFPTLFAATMAMSKVNILLQMARKFGALRGLAGLRPRQRWSSIGGGEKRQICRDKGKVAAAIILTAVCVLSGTMLLALPVAHALRCEKLWEARFGGGVRCVRPKFWFHSSSATCGMEHVETIDCQNDNSLPPINFPEWPRFNASDLPRLECINMVNVVSLETIPTYFREPRSLTTISLQRSGVETLPSAFCRRPVPTCIAGYLLSKTETICYRLRLDVNVTYDEGRVICQGDATDSGANPDLLWATTAQEWHVLAEDIAEEIRKTSSVVWLGAEWTPCNDSFFKQAFGNETYFRGVDNGFFEEWASPVDGTAATMYEEAGRRHTNMPWHYRVDPLLKAVWRTELIRRTIEDKYGLPRDIYYFTDRRVDSNITFHRGKCTGDRLADEERRCLEVFYDAEAIERGAAREMWRIKASTGGVENFSSWYGWQGRDDYQYMQRLLRRESLCSRSRRAVACGYRPLQTAGRFTASGKALPEVNVTGSPAATKALWHGAQPPIRRLSDITDSCRDAIIHTVQHLDLSNNDIGHDTNNPLAREKMNDIDSLARLISPQLLRQVNLSSNSISVQDSGRIWPGFPMKVASDTEDPSVCLLDLSGNARLTKFNIQGTKEEVDGYLRCLPTELADLTIGPSIGRIDVSRLTQRYTNLQRLTLKGVAAARPLGERGLQHLSRLQHLEIDRCPSADLLQTGSFRGLTSLTSLRINDSPIRELPSMVDLGNLTWLNFTNLQAAELSTRVGFAVTNTSTFLGLKALTHFKWVGHLETDAWPAEIFSPMRSLESLELIDRLLENKEQNKEDWRRDFCGFCSAHLMGLPHLRRLQLKPLPSITSDIFANLSALETLHLPGAYLVSISPDAFRPLARLKAVNLEDNSITKLPKTLFAGLASLTSLNLKLNKLTAVTYEFVSDETNLAELWLDNNDIRTVEHGAFDQLTNIKLLSLSGNAIAEAFPRNMSGQLPHSLEVLLLEGTAITSIPARSFAGLERLVRVVLALNPIASLSPRAFEGINSTTRVNVSLHVNLNDPFQKLWAAQAFQPESSEDEREHRAWCLENGAGWSDGQFFCPTLPPVVFQGIRYFVQGAQPCRSPQDWKPVDWTSDWTFPPVNNRGTIYSFDRPDGAKVSVYDPSSHVLKTKASKAQQLPLSLDGASGDLDWFWYNTGINQTFPFDQGDQIKETNMFRLEGVRNLEWRSPAGSGSAWGSWAGFPSVARRSEVEYYQSNGLWKAHAQHSVRAGSSWLRVVDMSHMIMYRASRPSVHTLVFVPAGGWLHFKCGGRHHISKLVQCDPWGSGKYFVSEGESYKDVRPDDQLPENNPREETLFCQTRIPSPAPVAGNGTMITTTAPQPATTSTAPPTTTAPAAPTPTCSDSLRTECIPAAEVCFTAGCTASGERQWTGPIFSACANQGAADCAPCFPSSACSNIP